MLTLQIDNAEIEAIFKNSFNSNKEMFFEFIKDAYRQKTSIERYYIDKERFMQTYESIKNGSMQMFTQSEADKEIDRFLEQL
jgi:hypothetical protein